MVNLISFDHSYTIEQREKVLLNGELKNKNGVLLKTCNRIELYYGEGDIPLDITRHLFRVASGLESKLIGEKNIQNQIKEAYLNSFKNNIISKELHILFQRALHVGKKVRNLTNISKGAITHSNLVIDRIKKHFNKIENLVIIIIGINKINEDIIKFLKNYNIKSIILANRTFYKALELAKKYKFIEPINLSNLKEVINNGDILISSTSAPHLIIKKQDINTNKKILMFDLAIPRDIDPEIAGYENIILYNIEDLEKFTTQNYNNRIIEKIKVEKIIEEEIIKFYEYLKRRNNFSCLKK